MNPPSVYELTSPSSQSTSKITNTVHSITFLSVGSHVPSCDAVPLRLWKAKFLHGSPVCSVPYEWPRLQLFHYGTQVPFRGFKLSTRGIVIASCQIDHDTQRVLHKFFFLDKKFGKLSRAHPFQVLRARIALFGKRGSQIFDFPEL